MCRGSSDFLDARKIIQGLLFGFGEVSARALLFDEQDALPKQIDKAVLPSSFLTGSSKLATRRRVTPNTSKNSL